MEGCTYFIPKMFGSFLDFSTQNVVESKTGGRCQFLVTLRNFVVYPK